MPFFNSPRGPAAHRVSGLIALLGGLIFAPAKAIDLGRLGPVYAIAEPNLLAEMHTRLQQLQASGALARHTRAATARITAQLAAPRAVAGITHTRVPRSFEFDPTIEVPYPVTDAAGRVLVAPGTRLNPLTQVTLPQPLLFLDARDEAQIAAGARWLRDRQGRLQVILTGGSYLALMRRWQKPVFFDQAGRLTHRLGIRHVPALVTQAGLKLHIDELR